MDSSLIAQTIAVCANAAECDVSETVEDPMYFTRNLLKMEWKANIKRHPSAIRSVICIGPWCQFHPLYFEMKRNSDKNKNNPQNRPPMNLKHDVSEMRASL